MTNSGERLIKSAGSAKKMVRAKGFFDGLSEAQKQAALAYRGPENFGPLKPVGPAQELVDQAQRLDMGY